MKGEKMRLKRKFDDRRNIEERIKNEENQLNKNQKIELKSERSKRETK